MQPLQQIHDSEADDVDDQRSNGIAPPVRLGAVVDASHAVDTTLEPTEDRREPGAPPLVDGRHEESQRLRREHEQREVETEL